MLIGLVIYFDTVKGYGFVGTPNGDQYFLHINSFVIKPDILSIGTPISFHPKKNKGKNRNSAINSRLIGLEEDWKIIFSYLDKSDLILKNRKDKVFKMVLSATKGKKSTLNLQYQIIP